MSSRLLRAQEAAVQPLQWNPVGAPFNPSAGLFAEEAARTPTSEESNSRLLGELAGKHRQELAALRAEVEKRARAEREAGHREGEQAGRQQARQELESSIAKLAEEIQEIAALRARLRLEVEADLVRLAVAIARRIVYRELNTDPEAVAGIVRAAFEKLRLQETIRLNVHPALAEPLRKLLARGNGSHIEVAADQTLAPGTVIFETARGSLDVSVETQLREIERGLTDRLRAAGL